MTKYYAVGTLDAWNALSSGEQAVFEAHYLTLANASSAYPSTPLDDYEFRFISDLEGDVLTTYFTIDTNGYRLFVKSFNFEFTSNFQHADITIQDITSVCDIDFQISKINTNVEKSGYYDSFLRVQDSANVTLNIGNCEIKGIANKGIFLYCTNVNDSIITASNNIINGLAIGFYFSSGLNTTINIKYNTVNSCYLYGFRSLINWTISYNACFGSGTNYEGTYSGDFNASSDITGDVGYRSISAISALVDPSNDNFKPIKNGPLKINRNTYIGAIQLRRRVKNGKRKLILMEMEDAR